MDMLAKWRKITFNQLRLLLNVFKHLSDRLFKFIDRYKVSVMRAGESRVMPNAFGSIQFWTIRR